MDTPDVLELPNVDIGIPCNILAIIFGAVGMNQAKQGIAEGEGMAKAGLICGIIGVFAVAAWTFGAVPADAQVRKAGLTGASFLKIGVGARAVALGSSYTTIRGDVNQMFWNPAGMSLR